MNKLFKATLVGIPPFLGLPHLGHCDPWTLVGGIYLGAFALVTVAAFSYRPPAFEPEDE